MTRAELWDLCEKVWKSLGGHQGYIDYMRPKEKLPEAIEDVAVRMFTHGKCQGPAYNVIRYQILYMQTHGVFDVEEIHTQCEEDTQG